MVDTVLIVANVVLITLIFVALVAVYAARYKRVPPNHAMVLFGRRYGAGPDAGMYVCMSGGRFIQPIVESYAFLSLEPVEIAFYVNRVRKDAKGASPQDVAVDVKAVVKIPPKKEEIEKAARHFLHRGDFLSTGRIGESQGVRKTEEAMTRAVSGVLEMHTRGVVPRSAVATPEAEIADAVSAAAKPDLEAMGIRVVSLIVNLDPASDSPRSREPAESVLASDLQRIDARLRRIEERLGLALPP